MNKHLDAYRKALLIEIEKGDTREAKHAHMGDYAEALRAKHYTNGLRQALLMFVLTAAKAEAE